MKQENFPFPTRNKPSVAMISAAKAGAYQLALDRARLANVLEQERLELIEVAKEEGIGIVHIFDKENPKGGLTVAFRKNSPYKSGKMVSVAVATCSTQDTFSKKLGTKLAIQEFLEGKTINLPLLVAYEDEDINGAVKRAFSALYGIFYN